MNVERMKEIVSDHKKEIVIIAELAAITVAGIVIAKRMPKVVDLSGLEWSTGKVVQLWEERHSNGEAYAFAIVDKLTIEEVGQFVKKMAEEIDGIDLDAGVSALIGFKKK